MPDPATHQPLGPQPAAAEPSVRQAFLTVGRSAGWTALTIGGQGSVATIWLDDDQWATLVEQIAHPSLSAIEFEHRAAA